MAVDGLFASAALFFTGLLSGFWLERLRGASQPRVKRKEGKKLPKQNGSYKMVLVVNSQLKMGKGKIAAQCCHAAVGVVDEYKGKSEHRHAFSYWSANGQPKIALQTNELAAIHKAVRKTGLPHYLVCDAGKTQIPAGSQTVLAIGPGLVEELDELTGSLRLL
ncbi:hypothetical protein WJX73_006899 [Symbiochloris irregularis]|uniref:peptidyl-tRNA hydrolase n=1 Tax=Symbiochloris irregularis TaxID=706552 RepID=A0AAW1PQX6_9CHLO